MNGRNALKQRWRLFAIFLLRNAFPVTCVDMVSRRAELSAISVLLVCVSLISHLAIGSFVLIGFDRVAQVDVVRNVATICHINAQNPDATQAEDKTSAPRHRTDAQACPLAFSLNAGAINLSDPVLIACATVLSGYARYVLPPLRAPPTFLITANHPRGPPNLA